MALSHLHRLPLRFERDRLNAQGERYQSHFFTLLKTPSPQSVTQARFAVLVSKKHSPLAITRNKLKRLTTEALTTFLSIIPSADYLLIPKKDLLSASFPDLVNDLKSLILQSDQPHS